jgi:hypothetical protein
MSYGAEAGLGSVLSFYSAISEKRILRVLFISHMVH